MKKSKLILSIAVLALVFCFLVSGCTDKSQMAEAEVPTTTLQAPIIEQAPIPLSWENGSLERQAWSKFVMSQVKTNFAAFDGAKDAAEFCKKYSSLSEKIKISLWSEMIVRVAFHESGWKPTARMIEPQSSFPKPDPVTKRPVASEGLLQLSYQDGLWTKTCRFDWSKDKALADNDSKKTIFDPYINLQCGIDIMTKQLKKYQRVTMASNVYWSVLKINGKYSKIKQIQARTQAMPFCN